MKISVYAVHKDVNHMNSMINDTMKLKELQMEIKWGRDELIRGIK